jgi:peptidoglycan-associated lipoprotein
MAESAASAAPQPLPAQAEAPNQIRVSDDIRRACKDYDLPRAHFEFDSANLRQNYARELNGIVQCFTTGPLAGRKLIVVGHADPRGSNEYNLALGGQRAESVKEHFKQAGLPDARILTSSRGEMDARGTDEQSWYQDRRVDLKLDGSS